MEGPAIPHQGRIRLAFGAFLWRAFAILAVVGELALWAAIRRRGQGFPPRLRLAWLLGYTPRTLFLAFFLAAVLTVAVDLFVRLVVDRGLRRWLSPPPGPDDEDGVGFNFGFHLGATERVAGSIPARRLGGPRSEPGSLVLTDRRLWFFPASWDAEPWSVPLDRVRSASAGAPSGFLWGLVRGLPPDVVIDAGPGPDSRATFALAEPARLLSWFDAEPSGGPSPRRPPDPPQP